MKCQQNDKSQKTPFLPNIVSAIKSTTINYDYQTSNYSFLALGQQDIPRRFMQHAPTRHLSYYGRVANWTTTEVDGGLRVIGQGR
jgi:hypothetical protein